MTAWLFWATMGALAVLVAALAVYLLVVIRILWKIRATAGLVLFGVRAIAHRAEPLDDLLEEINHDLEAVRSGLREVIGPPREAPDEEQARALTPHQRVRGGIETGTRS